MDKIFVLLHLSKGMINLFQYLPKFVKPMEDIRRVLAKEVVASASPRLRKLLCLDYPYPEVLDEAEPVNSEGSQSHFKWK